MHVPALYLGFLICKTGDCQHRPNWSFERIEGVKRWLSAIRTHTRSWRQAVGGTGKACQEWTGWEQREWKVRDGCHLKSHRCPDARSLDTHLTAVHEGGTLSFSAKCLLLFPGKFPFILQDSVFLCEAFFASHRGMGRRKQLLCAKHLGWVLYIHNSHAYIKAIVSHYNYLFVIASLISAEGKDCSLYWCFKPRGL